jgi:sulfate permease, SulP family
MKRLLRSARRQTARLLSLPDSQRRSIRWSNFWFNFWPDLRIGLATGAVGLGFNLAFAILMFSGRLTEYRAVGVGLVLCSVAMTRIITLLMSAYPGTVADVGTVPMIILIWSINAVVQQLSPTANSAQILTTVLATISLISLATGAFLLLLGLFEIGAWARAIPPSVMGGVVASSGWLLVQGGFQVMVEQSLVNQANQPLINQSLVNQPLATLASLVQPQVLLHCLPGLILGILLLLISQRYSQPSAMLVSLLFAVGLFYLVLFLTGRSIVEADAQDWILGAFPVSFLGWSTLTLTLVDWPTIAEQWICIITIMVIAAVSIALNISGIEVIADREIDLSWELKVAGIANLLVGLGGGVLSYHSLSKSVLAQRMGRSSRLATLTTGLGFVGFALFGSGLLPYLPKSVLGGLLLFLGLSLLKEWVYDAWFNLTILNYLTVVLILAISSLIGFWQGLVASWLLGAMFVATRRMLNA